MSSPEKGLRKSRSKVQSTFIFFWFKENGEWRVIRIEFNQIFYPTLDQLKRHVANQFGLPNLPELVFVDKAKTKKNEKNEHNKNKGEKEKEWDWYVVESLKQLLGREQLQFAVLPVGFTNKNSTPGFMVHKEDLEAMDYLFRNWDRLMEKLQEQYPQQKLDTSSVASGKSYKPEFSSIKMMIDSDGNLSENFVEIANEFGITLNV